MNRKMTLVTTKHNVHSRVKCIKIDKQSSTSTELLDDLLIINIDNVNMEDFRTDHGIDSWWKAKTRHLSQQLRKAYRKKQKGTDTRGIDTCTTTSDSDSNSSLVTVILLNAGAALNK